MINATKNSQSSYFVSFPYKYFKAIAKENNSILITYNAIVYILGPKGFILRTGLGGLKLSAFAWSETVPFIDGSWVQVISISELHDHLCARSCGQPRNMAMWVSTYSFLWCHCQRFMRVIAAKNNLVEDRQYYWTSFTGGYWCLQLYAHAPGRLEAYI